MQNTTDINQWRSRVLSGQFAVQRGIRLDAEDRARRALIERIMCDLTVDVAAVAAPFGFTAADFTTALLAIERDGLARVDGTRVTLAPAFRPFLRTVAAAFDTYLSPEGGRHARAV